ncbi:MAG TPA: hypothetical protein VG104_01935 [Candidatus Dormibacteraeota bacterium]|jgi:hypothetical protein|nr:hypothetical protein [Candidatus Dormibacteraeota bacterium]
MKRLLSVVVVAVLSAACATPAGSDTGQGSAVAGAPMVVSSLAAGLTAQQEPSSVARASPTTDPRQAATTTRPPAASAASDDALSRAQQSQAPPLCAPRAPHETMQSACNENPPVAP